MKKLILILSIIFITSCSKDEDTCKCNGKYKLFTYPEQFYYKPTTVDCNTNQPIGNESQTNSFFIGCE